MPTATPAAPIPRRTRGLGRTCVVPVRLAPDDRDALAAWAASHDTTVSTVLGTLGAQLARGGGDRVTVLDPTAWRQLAIQLARLGNNLNQLVKQANRGTLGVESAEHLQSVVDDIHALVRQVV